MEGYANGRSVVVEGLHGTHQQRYYQDMSGSLTTSGGSNNNSRKVRSSSSGDEDDDDEMNLRRGPWTAEEDRTLMSYIAKHGEGRWNSLARRAGLKRTGKSCRLRWLNYLRPDVRRGNITLEEQLLILQLHSRWGNRWSKIAQYLPGRTDNEIKNYWRTRVQKHAKQLKCDVNSKQFKDTMRYLWIPRLVERIKMASNAPDGPSASQNPHAPLNQDMIIQPSATPAAFSDSFSLPGGYDVLEPQIRYPDGLISPAGYYHPQNTDFQSVEHSNINSNVDQWAVEGEEFWDNLWNVEDIWFL